MSDHEYKRAEREAWLKAEIQKIKDGGTVELSCVMATPERLDLMLCSGVVPKERAHRGSHTCSPECQADYKRLMRWELSKGVCRACGHNLPKKRRRAAAKSPETGFLMEALQEV